MKTFNITGSLENANQNAIQKLIDDKIIERIWKKDFTVWNNDPTEISNRLGWLDCTSVTRKSFEEIHSFVNELKAEGIKNILLLGMGGSSLAPEVFSLVFGNSGDIKLSILDSTHPVAVLEKTKNFNPEKTLYIVSTKSGGTVETISFMKFFYNFVLDKLGKEKVSRHFAAITDPDSGLEQMAKELNFRKIFLNDPNIGGRFSALSLFGIVPAAIVGVDIEKLFIRADSEVLLSKKSGIEIDRNNSALFGALIGVLAEQGKDKLTLVTSEKINPFGAWIEQLVAESTGKNNQGILPVDLEEILIPEFYGEDRVFIHIKLRGDNKHQNKIDKFIETGFPVIEFELEDIYDLSKQFFLWEFATSISGWYLGIQPFDQPNVEQAKVIARKILKDYQESGKLNLPVPSFSSNDLIIYSEEKIDKPESALELFLSECESGKNYVSIQAYVNPSWENFNLLQKLRTDILKKYKVATTLGFGPRFLHSTGQLHKGDSGNGLFIQIIDNPEEDVAIPDNASENKSSISFGVLIKAQAFGDRQALLDNKRKVITIEVKDSLETLLNKFQV
ncbi:MAG: glucose-6-phosphate isomerase [Ignavibacterium sp.]|uniref:glucose-6-phosphate isomerase n=1 Tax=Ignavibacterium sp. TaxID=2651167 RepID=UPI0032970159